MTAVAGQGDDERLARAVKSRDSTFTTFLVSPYSRLIARWAARRGFDPTAVTLLSIALGFAAAGLFAVGQRPALVAGAVALQVAFTADCVDGQLARCNGRTSDFGGWLDAMGDRAKEYAVYAGLAAGSLSGFDDPVWPLAVAALALQTFRHTVDYGYLAAARAREGSAPPSRRSVVAGAGAPASSVTVWIKRSAVLPIGERFALISIMAALFTPRATFVALLCWGSIAAAYGLAGKSWRSVGPWTG